MLQDIFDVPNIESVLVEDENGELGVDLTDLETVPSEATGWQWCPIIGTPTKKHDQRFLHLPQRLAISLDSQGQPVHWHMPCPLVQNSFGRVHVQNS